MPDLYIKDSQKDLQDGSEKLSVEEENEQRINKLRSSLRGETAATHSPPTPVHEEKKHRKSPSKTTKESKERKQLTQTEIDLNNKKKGKFHHKNGLFSSMAYMPEKIAFETQQKGEEIVLLVRQHPIVNVKWIFISTLLFLIPSFALRLPFISLLPAGYIVSFSIIWYLIVFGYVLEGFLGWFFNVGFLTDERVIDVDFHNIIHKEISSAKIDTIQDVSYTQGGTFQAIFNYGDIFIQTAAEKPRFEFLKIPRPDRIANIINDLKLQEEQEKIEGRVR